MRSPFSLKSAHLLMWSSPLLLLVLVFTLTSTSAPSAPVASSPPPSSTSPITTLVPSSTTTPTTKATTPVIVIAKTTETTLSTTSVEKSFSSATTTTVKPVASIPSASAMNGALSGTLAPGFEVVDVPLLGPGDWTLSATAPTTQTLDCGGDASPVVNQVVVGQGQNCQLVIASSSAGTSTWQLTPNT